MSRDGYIALRRRYQPESVFYDPNIGLDLGFSPHAGFHDPTNLTPSFGLSKTAH
jgi:hypothetical protein